MSSKIRKCTLLITCEAIKTASPQPFFGTSFKKMKAYVSARKITIFYPSATPFCCGVFTHESPYYWKMVIIFDWSKPWHYRFQIFFISTHFLFFFLGGSYPKKSWKNRTNVWYMYWEKKPLRSSWIINEWENQGDLETFFNHECLQIFEKHIPSKVHHIGNKR